VAYGVISTRMFMECVPMECWSITMRRSAVRWLFSLGWALAGCGGSGPSPFDDVLLQDDDGPPGDAPGEKARFDALRDGTTGEVDVGSDTPSPSDDDALTPLDADASSAADGLDVAGELGVDGAMDDGDGGNAAGEHEGGAFDGVLPMCPGMFRSTITLPSATPVTVMGTTEGSSHNASTSCRANTGGSEDYHRLDVTSRSVVSLSTEGAATHFDTVLAVRRNCTNPSSELACDDDGGEVPLTASRLRVLLDPGSYALLVDGDASASGRYQLTARATVAAPNGSCRTATTLAAGTTLRAQSVDGGYDPVFPCLPLSGGGQLFYAIDVPAGNTAVVTATPTGGAVRQTPVLRVFEHCAASSCVSSSVGTAGMPGSVAVNNDTGAPRRYLVSLSTASASEPAAFDVALAVGLSRAGTACSVPLPLEVGAALRGSFTDAMVSTSVCRPGASGRVLYYRVTVPAETRLDLQVTPEGAPPWIPVLRVLDDCAARTCVFDGQGTTAGMPYTLSIANTGSGSRSYVVAVGATASSNGSFTLRASTTRLSEGARCAAPFTLRPDMPVLGRNLADGVDFVTACRPNADGRVQYYTFDLPGRSIATLRVTPSSSPGWTPAVRVLSSCEATECLFDELGSFGAPSAHVFANEDASDRRVYVAIGASTSSATGTYDLALTTAPASVGEVCSQAIVLTPGTPRIGQRLEDGRLAPSLCRVSGGAVRYYALTVDGRQAYTVRVTPTSTSPAWTPQVRVFEGCAATRCEFDALGNASMPLTVTGLNESVTPRTYTVSVNASVAVASGTYDIVAGVSDPAPGALCSAPLPLSPSAPAMNQNTANGAVSSLACLPASNGGQLFYGIRIPPGQRVRIVATPVSGTTASPVLRAIDSCVAVSCLGSVTGTSTGATLDLPNYDPSPRDVIVSLGTTSRTVHGTYNVTATFAPVMEGQFCDRATALVVGTTLRGNTGNGVTTAFGCLNGSYGPQLFYRVTVPAGRRVLVSARPMTATVALRLRAVSSCASTVCHASSTTAAPGMPATLALTTPTLTERQVFFSVAASLASTATDFTLTAAEEPLVPAPMDPYTVTLISASCDSLAGAATIAPTGGWTDDSVTPLGDLPFPFRLFGDTTTRFVASSNGNLQLFADIGASPSSSGVNVPLPSTELPNGLVAPFWDDFTADAMGFVRVATFGLSGSRRFVVEWRNWRFAAEPGAALNFQVKLFEGSNVVEFHYCPSSTVGSERTIGSSATLGLENLAGTAGALVSLDWPGNTRPGNGWRLTPR